MWMHRSREREREEKNVRCVHESNVNNAIAIAFSRHLIHHPHSSYKHICKLLFCSPCLHITSSSFSCLFQHALVICIVCTSQCRHTHTKKETPKKIKGFMKQSPYFAHFCYIFAGVLRVYTNFFCSVHILPLPTLHPQFFIKLAFFLLSPSLPRCFILIWSVYIHIVCTFVQLWQHFCSVRAIALTQQLPFFFVYTTCDIFYQFYSVINVKCEMRSGRMDEVEQCQWQIIISETKSMQTNRI